MPARERFRALLARDRNPVRLRRLPPRQEYSQYSDEVADHCDVLIAVWDGNPAHGRGGTAEVVEYAMHRQRPVAVIPAHKPKSVKIHAGFGLNAQAVTGIEAFNRRRPKPATNKDYGTALEKTVLQGPGTENIPQSTKTLIRNELFPYYIRASSMAKGSQRWHYWAGRLGYSLSALAVAPAGAAVLFPEHARLAFGLEFLCLAVIVGSVTWTHRRRSHQKWIESRFLTERLRSAFCLAGCGMEASAIETPPYFGR